MSKPRYPWWSYVKAVVRRYPDNSEKERAAVAATIEEYSKRPDMLQLIDLVYWRKLYTLPGAAAACAISYATARLWHREFMYCVAKHLGLE